MYSQGERSYPRWTDFAWTENFQCLYTDLFQEGCFSGFPAIIDSNTFSNYLERCLDLPSCCSYPGFTKQESPTGKCSSSVREHIGLLTQEQGSLSHMETGALLSPKETTKAPRSVQSSSKRHRDCLQSNCGLLFISTFSFFSNKTVIIINHDCFEWI